VFEKNNLYYNRWRNVQLYSFPEWARSPESEEKRAAELKRLDTQIAEMEAEIENVRKPASHHFELKPVSQ
jgi:hypothetical protein